MAPKCQSFWGHRFEPRYSTEPPDQAKMGQMEGQGLHLIIRALSRQTYHGDVCRRCGVFVNAPSPGGSREE